MPVSLIFTAKSTNLFINVADIDLIRGNNTKEQTFLQLTDVTSEFIKAQPKNRYGEKILSADVVGPSGDIADLQFNNLEIGKFYELSGQIYSFEDGARTNEITVWSGANQTGTQYGALHINAATNVQRLLTNVSIKFKAESSTLYVNMNNLDELFGDGTKNETFLQLEERRDLEETNNFD
jgi:hypothetical protein